MIAIDTEADARERRYANWIGVLALWTGVATTGTLLYVGALLFGWTGPVAGAAALALGQLTAAIGAYPFFEASRARGGLSRLRFRTFAIRMAVLAAGLFVWLVLFNRYG